MERDPLADSAIARAPLQEPAPLEPVTMRMLGGLEEGNWATVLPSKPSVRAASKETPHVLTGLVEDRSRLRDRPRVSGFTPRREPTCSHALPSSNPAQGRWIREDPSRRFRRRHGSPQKQLLPRSRLHELGFALPIQERSSSPSGRARASCRVAEFGRNVVGPRGPRGGDRRRKASRIVARLALFTGASWKRSRSSRSHRRPARVTGCPR